MTPAQQPKGIYKSARFSSLLQLFAHFTPLQGRIIEAHVIQNYLYSPNSSSPLLFHLFLPPLFISSSTTLLLHFLHITQPSTSSSSPVKLLSAISSALSYISLEQSHYG